MISSSGVVTGVAPGVATTSFTTTAGCIATKTVTINASAALSGITSLCPGQTTTLTDGSVTGGTWSSSNNSGATVGGGSGVVTALSAGTITINYTSPSGCVSTLPFTVNALSATTGASNICQGQTTTLVNTTAGGGVWSSDNTSVTTISGSGVVSGVGAGVANISFVTTAGCVATKVFTVNASAPVTGTVTVCVGQPFTLSNSVSGGTWSSSNNSDATVGASTGVVTPVASGSLSINYTSPAGCVSSLPITVNPLAATTGPSAVCQGQAITLVNATSGGGGWSIDNSSIAMVNSSGGVNGLSAGTATVTFTTVGGCLATKVIAVNSLSGISGATTICAGQNSLLSDAVSGGTWSSNNIAVASVDNTGLVTGAISGSATIAYTTSSGCSTNVIITVNGTPAPISGVTNICAGSIVSLSDAVTGGVWSSDNTSVAIANGRIITGATVGVADITYTTANGCYLSVPVNVVQSPGPITGAAAVCVGAAITLSDNISGGTWSATSGSIASVNPVSGAVTGISAGTTAIGYMVGTCLTTYSVTVNSVSPIAGPSSVCSGASIALSDPTAGGVWSSDNTSAATASGGIVVGVVPGVANISYTSASGCYVVSPITVLPGAGTILGTPALCVTSAIQLSDAVGGGTWSINPSSTALVNASDGTITGIAVGTAQVTYMLGTCSTTTSVVVNAMPSVIGGVAGLCSGTLALSDAVSGGIWSSNNTATAAVGAINGVVTAGVAGSAAITYTLSGGCAVTTTINVSPLPAITGATVVCAGLTTPLSESVTGGTWSTSLASVATAVPATGIITGVGVGSAIITYTHSGGCYAIITVSVTASPAVITGTQVICAGHTTTLYDGTTGGAWSTSTSSTATVGSTGIVTGVSAGLAAISYAVGGGCPRIATVTVNPSGKFTGLSVVCTGQTITLSSGSATGGTWSSSNPGYATVTSTGVVSGVAVGTPAIISYSVPPGCISLDTLTIHPLSVTTGSSTACVGTTTQLYNTTTGGGSWSTGNSAIATINSTGLLSGVAAGGAPIIFTTAQGCVTTKTITVNVCPAKMEDSTTDINSPVIGVDNIKLFPNPNSGIFNVRGLLADRQDAEVSIEITDMLGQLVYRNSFIAQSGNINEQIQINNAIANSMYLVTIRSGGVQKVFHIVIEQ